MSEESPPTYTTSIFNQANFGTTDGGLDTAYLNSHYLRYPTAQTGLETIANLATTNDATINGLTVGTGSGSGIENTAIGESALASATTASQNTAVGHEALYATTTSGTQTAVGFHALRNATGSNNLAIGYRALRGTAGTNTGTYNYAIGEDALFQITTGSSNTSLGYRALYANATGDANIAIGYGSLIANTGGGNNIGIGNNALSKLTIQSNSVGVGTNALFANTGSNNTAIGDAVLYGQVGSSTGSSNTGVGSGALSSITTGANNVAVGRNAGTSGTAITTGSNNTFIGYQAQANANNYSNSTALGSGAIITASNQVVLGTTTETVVIPNQIQHNYSSLPTFTSTSIGYTTTFSLATLALGTGTRNTIDTSIALPVGVYMCHLYYQVNITFPGTTRTVLDFRITSGATLVAPAVMGFVYSPAVQEYNYYSIPAILKVSANPCSVYTILTSAGANCSINTATLGVVRVA